MLAHRRRGTAAAIALTAAITTGTAALLTGCGPSSTTTATATPTARATGGPTSEATPTGAAPASQSPTGAAPGGAAPTGSTSPPASSPGAAPTSRTPTRATPSAAAPAPVVNGTAHSALTISNGTDHVLMNGTSVDFGTIVRDLAWSPNGAKAAFINGSGDLVVSNPDGSGRVIVARNPGGQTWSHPTWQVTAGGDVNGVPAKNSIFFAVYGGGVSRLEGVSAGAVNAAPTVLSLGGYSGDHVTEPPQTGNTWPNVGGSHGDTVYSNVSTGEVFIRDDYLRQQGGAITQGSEPALSPAEDRIVFVRSVGAHDHLFEADLDGRNPKDLTPNATTDYTEPAWSPDGTTIAVRTPTGIATVAADGSSGPTRVSTLTGMPAYRR